MKDHHWCGVRMCCQLSKVCQLLFPDATTRTIKVYVQPTRSHGVADAEAGMSGKKPTGRPTPTSTRKGANAAQVIDRLKSSALPKHGPRGIVCQKGGTQVTGDMIRIFDVGISLHKFERILSGIEFEGYTVVYKN